MDSQLLLKFLKVIREYDIDLFWHSLNVANLALRINYELEFEGALNISIVKGALLHDLGKTRIDPNILNKPGPLTESEWQEIHKHPLWGVRMLAEKVTDPFLLDLVRLHHERWDGNGYYGYRGEEIPLAARIITLADALDAMISPRPYRQSRRPDQALNIIKENAGTQFDPGLVQALKCATWQPENYCCLSGFAQVIEAEETWLDYLMRLEDKLFRLLEQAQRQRLNKIKFSGPV
ncbi:MAG: hypothetical protein PWP65_1505 [Clostridia bacterium]|nr:hypothetical protein [Clostridia bacterium]